MCGLRRVEFNGGVGIKEKMQEEEQVFSYSPLLAIVGVSSTLNWSHKDLSSLLAFLDALHFLEPKQDLSILRCTGLSCAFQDV